MKKQIINAIHEIIEYYPDVIPLLSRKARYIWRVNQRAETKTAEAYERQIWNRILELYRGEIDDGAFVDALAEIIQFQLTKAFREALRDNELEAAQVEDEPYATALEDMILNEFDFVDGLAGDVAEARNNETGHIQFQARAEMWANRYTDAYNQCNVLIALEEGNNLIWVYADEKDHCDICRELNGIVAKASVWKELGVYPQRPPNALLESSDDKKGCGGWQCGCELLPTNKRQSPKAYESILNAVTK